MSRIEIDIKTGEKRVIPLTPAETARHQAAEAAEAAEAAQDLDRRSDPDAHGDVLFRALVVWLAGKLVISKAQARREIRDIARGLQ